MRVAGLDVGTTAVKAALFDAEGRLLDGLRRPMPPLVLDGPRAWQPLEEAVAAADAALDEVAGRGADLIALTTQRDTLVLLDAAGTPLTPLVSWRDARAGSGSFWDTLAETEPGILRGTAAVRSLASLLTERWTGRAADTGGTRPRHLKGAAEARLHALVAGVGQPEDVEAGTAVGAARGVPLHLASGDKNCELLGSGVIAPGRAGLSLGSAISLGLLAEGRPADGPGYVVTPAALAGRWNVETGLLAGMSAADHLAKLLGTDFTIGPKFVDVPLFLPHLAGALDRPGARAAISGWTEATTAPDLFQAWAQGVVCELRRLRPGLESAAGSAMTGVVISGGGAAAEAWAALVAAGLDLPSRRAGDRFSGARGAAAAALAHVHGRLPAAFLAGGTPDAVAAEPRPDAVAVATRHHQEYMRLFQTMNPIT